MLSNATVLSLRRKSVKYGIVGSGQQDWYLINIKSLFGSPYQCGYPCFSYISSVVKFNACISMSNFLSWAE